MSGSLSRAFHETSYVTAEGQVARIGRRSPELAALLRRLGARHGAFISAWNPMARAWSLRRNRQAQARLVRAARHWPSVSAHSQPKRASAARWREEQLFFAADRRLAVALARRFRQLAIVGVRPDGRAYLIWTLKL
ncbi:DUF3293 domain-containing protein [Roseomonas marmotae]|uniref:DUF3293 domain-containing protein n=1 Tax=Roseomonas marmotae TaxID=2768161 RepID=A0ABS3KGB2_9PROT|nr:DUF3293 domain-containing protein [Roseomonas marmotae]MBO1075381.1 DUF3293 domain-containing protein [Roseomonas marmotae]QTI78370.1 DUF3293 domain-containing protein [Roseomonas marmotae]